MALSKQAKVLTDAQIRAVLNHVGSNRHAKRDRVMVLLSVKAGLRAKEISCLTWLMVTDAQGQIRAEIRLPNGASKGKSSGRVIPMHKSLIDALAALPQGPPNDAIITSERCKSGLSAASVVEWFADTYRALGFAGASSHSGRRTFVTKAARSITGVGGSLRDVQALAGHSSLSTTERYIDQSSDAKARVVALI